VKGYCPNCRQEIDEIEFMELEGLCVVCYKNEQNLMQKNNAIKKENVLL